MASDRRSRRLPALLTTPACLVLAGCQLISGLDDLEAAGSTAASSSSAGGAGGGGAAAGGAGGNAPCPPGYLDANREEADGCELEAPIPTEGLALWLRADAGLQMTGARVAWLDQSTHRNDFEQTLQALFPTLESSALNGKPALRFFDQYLLGGLVMESGFGAGFTLAGVVQREDVGTDGDWDAVLDLQSPAGQNIFLVRSKTDDAFAFGCPQNEAGGVTTTALGAYPAAVPLVLVVVVDGPLVSIRVDGQDIMLDTTTLDPLPSSKTMSGVVGSNIDVNQHDHGLIAEVILYERAVEDVHALEQYLLQKYELAD
jgi:hypothetical protein